MAEPDTDRPYRGRRISWEEFYRCRPDLRPANDNENSDPQNNEKVNPKVIK